eukprot:704789_1
MALAQVQATYQTHIQTLKRPLYAFVKEETDLRLKYFVLIANHPVQSLRAILNLHSVPLDQYDMNSEIYQNFLSIAYEMIENKCNRGINFGRFKKEVNEKNVWNTLKGYWFHAVPAIITQYLWIPLLRDIALFYYRLADHWSTKQSQLDGLTLQKYLHKKFMASLLEVKCKINKHSNSAGAVIQNACWKQESFQQIICSHFDDNSGYTFAKWMDNPTDDTQKKAMRVQQIVSKYIKMHAQFECKRLIRSIGINTQYTEYKVAQTDLDRVSLFGTSRVPTIMATNKSSSVNGDQCDAKNDNTTQPPVFYNNTNNNNNHCQCVECAPRMQSYHQYHDQHRVQSYRYPRHHPYQCNCNCTHW